MVWWGPGDGPMVALWWPAVVHQWFHNGSLDLRRKNSNSKNDLQNIKRETLFQN
jgi:hypothetical protein